MLEAVTLQDLKRVVVGHDGQGHGAGVFLDKVDIKERDGENTNKLFVFSCNRWLDDHEDDFKTERELKLLGKMYEDVHISQPCYKHVTQYREKR